MCYVINYIIKTCEIFDMRIKIIKCMMKFTPLPTINEFKIDIIKNYNCFYILIHKIF